MGHFGEYFVIPKCLKGTLALLAFGGCRRRVLGQSVVCGRPPRPMALVVRRDRALLQRLICLGRATTESSQLVKDLAQGVRFDGLVDLKERR